MKLYGQLTEEQQHQAFHHALDEIVFNIAEVGEFKYMIDDDVENKEELEIKIADLNSQLSKLISMDDKCDLIMSDEFDDVFEELAGLAQGIASSSWFKECGESVIPICALEEHNHDGEENEVVNKKNNSSDLN